MMQYKTVCLTCSKKLTDSQLSLPHLMNKNVKEKKNNRTTGKIPVTSIIRTTGKIPVLFYIKADD